MAKILNKEILSKKHFLKIYPIVLILLVPILLIINTLWNLKSFNRDANFIVRHQAVSIADTLKPTVSENIGTETNKLQSFINDIKTSNEDILDITILRDIGSGFEKELSTRTSDLDISSIEVLGNLARGGSQSYAGLSYDPIYGKNIWNVIIPIEGQNNENYMFYFVMDTASVSQIIQRTTKDSLTILIILIVATILILANHFYFYLRSLKTQQLEELDKMKDEFISIAAHELRAPVTAFNGYLDLLRGSTEKSGIFQSIKDNYLMLVKIGGDLNVLIDDLLNVSRIEQGRLKTEMKEVDVSQIVEEVIDANKAVAEEKGLKLSYEKAGEIPVTITDPQRLRQVVTNIVSNSLKYTLKGEVSVKVHLDGKNIRIVCKDTGIGIPPEQMSELFQKFHRVQDRQTSEVRGTGLGLWITKEIVEILGGRINLESIYGTGTSVTVLLPQKS